MKILVVKRAHELVTGDELVIKHDLFPLPQMETSSILSQPYTGEDGVTQLTTSHGNGRLDADDLVCALTEVTL